MAVTAVTRDRSQNKGEVPASEAGDRTIGYVVQVNTPNDTPDTIMGSGYLPAVGSLYPGSLAMTLRSYSFDHAGKLLWRATAKYSSKAETQKEREAKKIALNPLPWMRPPDITFHCVERAIEPVRDLDDEPIVNSFGDPFAKVPAQSIENIIVKVKKAFTQVPEFFWNLRMTCNDADVIVHNGLSTTPVFPAEHMRFVPGDISRVEDFNGQKFVWVTFELRGNHESWNPKIVDMGRRYRDLTLPVGKQVIPFVDGTASDGLLDGSGYKLLDGAEPHLIDFVYYTPTDYTVLPLVADG